MCTTLQPAAGRAFTSLDDYDHIFASGRPPPGKPPGTPAEGEDGGVAVHFWNTSDRVVQVQPAGPGHAGVPRARQLLPAAGEWARQSGRLGSLDEKIYPAHRLERAKRGDGVLPRLGLASRLGATLHVELGGAVVAAYTVGAEPVQHVIISFAEARGRAVARAPPFAPPAGLTRGQQRHPPPPAGALALLDAPPRGGTPTTELPAVAPRGSRPAVIPAVAAIDGSRLHFTGQESAALVLAKIDAAVADAAAVAAAGWAGGSAMPEVGPVRSRSRWMQAARCACSQPRPPAAWRSGLVAGCRAIEARPAAWSMADTARWVDLLGLPVGAPGKVVEALGLSGAKLLACDVGQLAASLGLQRLGHKKLLERGVGAVRWVDEGWRM